MRFQRRYIIAIVIAVFFGLGTFIHQTISAKNAELTKIPVNLRVKDIQELATVIAQIKHYYVKNVDEKDLINGAISGMLSNLDPHSSYLDADDLKELQTVTTGKFGGIGIEITPEDHLIKVVSPLDGTPAQKAGIKAGDIIVRIDNQFVKDITLDEAVKLMRGKKGSKVTLTIFRENEKKPLIFSITRDVIIVQTVKYKMLEDKYAYIRVAFFQTPAKKDLDNAVQKLKSEAGGHLDGLVLDLRNNPGGLLDSSVEVADSFLDSRNLKKNKLIVYTKGRIKGGDIQANATPGELLPNTPMVVLINSGSASASEIVAGALQDHKRAIIMGTKSFGKGSVQTVFPLGPDTGIKLTTALYYTPSGRSIQAEGIKPDIFVEELTIPKDKDDDATFDPLSENDLRGHLENGKATSKAAEEATKTDNQKEDDLLHSDYQLYEALLVLKGLHAMNTVQR